VFVNRDTADTAWHTNSGYKQVLQKQLGISTGTADTAWHIKRYTHRCRHSLAHRQVLQKQYGMVSCTHDHVTSSERLYTIADTAWHINRYTQVQTKYDGVLYTVNIPDTI
jgi:hypothetical protein